MRRSITEPLMQYFHDITLVSNDVKTTSTMFNVDTLQTSEHEEPDILNTPKSLILAPEAGKKLSRKLFSPKEQEAGLTKEAAKESKEESMQQTLQRHAARTSQINEYQNISPTPSTDL